MTDSTEGKDDCLYWVGFDLPFRDNSNGTYFTWLLHQQPKIMHEANRFAAIKTPEQLKKDSKLLLTDWESPTACYFDLENTDDDSVPFYCDQQSCVLWYFDKEEGCVLAVCDSDIQVVAPNLAEFLYRVRIENSLWFKCMSWRSEYKLVQTGKLSFDDWCADCGLDELEVDYARQLYDKYAQGKNDKE